MITTWTQGGGVARTRVRCEEHVSPGVVTDPGRRDELWATEDLRTGTVPACTSNVTMTDPDEQRSPRPGISQDANRRASPSGSTPMLRRGLRPNRSPTAHGGVMPLPGLRQIAL
jgi:hypothetical protein